MLQGCGDSMKNDDKLAQQEFEKVCSDWGFDFTKAANSKYESYATGSSFGIFLLGWDTHKNLKAKRSHHG